MKKALLLLFPFLFTLFFLPSGFSEGRTKNLEFIILLDKSLSMVDKIENVKTFFKTQVLEKSVIPGDKILIVVFYGKAELLLKKDIQGPKDIQEIETTLASIHGDGPFTDIGNAIDFTYDLVQKEDKAGELRRHFVLLTDGRQEAPEGSKYQSLDFSIKHPFLESAKNIQKSGWKVQILGIGTDTEAANLADELSGTSKIWTDSQSLLLEKSLDFEEEILLHGHPQVAYSPQGPRLQLTLDTFGLNHEAPLKIKQILAFSGETAEPVALLSQPVEVKATMDRLIPLSIPLSSPLSPVTLERSQFVVQFAGDLSLQPARFTAPSGIFFLQKEWEEYFPLGLALLIVLFIIILGRKTQSLYRKMTDFQRKNVVIS